jgi:hypothetical protein
MIERLKLLPPIVLMALTALLICGTVVLAQTVITRNGHISRTLTQHLNVSADQSLVMGLDETTGTVTYTVSNPGTATSNVMVTPTISSALEISADKTSFSLTPGSSQDVILTITFIDAGATSVDYSVVFSTG